MANIVERPISEEGIVLSKKYAEAKEARKMNINGVEKEFPATEEKYLVTVASSYECDAVNGLKSVTVLEYPVDKATFDKIKYQTAVTVTYIMTSYKTSPVSLKLK